MKNLLEVFNTSYELAEESVSLKTDWQRLCNMKDGEKDSKEKENSEKCSTLLTHQHKHNRRKRKERKEQKNVK